MTDEQYSEYMALWEQKQKAAADVAQRFYSDEMTSLVNEYVSKVPDALGIMKDDLYQVGQLAAKGLAQGILSQKSAVVSAARAVAAAARAALRSAEGIHSPAKKWAVLDCAGACFCRDGQRHRQRTVGGNGQREHTAYRSAGQYGRQDHRSDDF